MSFAIASTVIAGGSLVGGLLSSNKAAKQQKQALALQREQLAYAKQKDAENKALYGGITQQVVDQAAKGVDPNLTQVSNEAATDAKTAFAGAQGALERNQQRMGINPNSGRAEAQLQDAKLSEALAVAGGTTKARANERNNAETQTFNRRLSVAQMGNGQTNNSQAAVTNAGNGVANTLNGQAAQSGADAAGYGGAALDMGLKAAQLYGSRGTAPATTAPNLSNLTGNTFLQAPPSLYGTSNYSVVAPPSSLNVPSLSSNNLFSAPPSLIPGGI